MKKLNIRNNGFTLIELLVVATIIIILATLGVVSYRNASIRSRNGKRKADLEVVRQAMIMYRSEEGQYPVGTFTQAINELESNGYLVAAEIKDPQENNYEYSGNSLKAYLEPDSTLYEVSLP